MIVLVSCLAFSARAAERLVQIGAGADSASVRVPIGKSDSVRTSRSFIDVLVADPEVADVVPLTDHSLSVLGKKVGTTRVAVYGENKSLVGVIDVEVSYDTSQLSGELRRRFPSARFVVTSVNGRLMLSGTSPDAITLDRAVTLAKQFGPEVINSVRVLQPQQVMLEVRFIEASRSAARELGISWKAVSKNLNATIGNAGVLSGNTPFGVVVGKILSGGAEVDPMITALEEKGLARRLAEPNLVALSGDTASFLAGGEFPIPVQSNLGTVTVEFKKYGVGLAFTPTVLDNSVINIKIEPEVSQLDPTNSVQVGTIRIPSLIVRRANTTIELRDGQSFAIAGLLQTITTADQEQFPWLGDVPVLGALIRSASYQKKETDLAIIVTPRLVEPTRPGDVLKTPLDSAVAANDSDLFLYGKNELSARQLQKAIRPTEKQARSGHILDLSNGAPNVAQ
jgi:pilus assembly protein CpaC